MGRASGGSPQTDALVFGSGTSPRGQNESWNGTAWTELSDLNTGAAQRGASSTGSTNAMAFGGRVNPPVTANTEVWNGSSWTEVADASAGAGKVADSDSSSTAAFFAGGDGPPGGAVATTEEWLVPESISNLTITD